ncbi:MAG: isochorismate synthase [Desertifilum sp. SIO1I2]|nr:isochorismate synthase [Desertifilum sp. SIO1I2]
MNIAKSFSEFVQYLLEAATRTFQPNEEEYPEIGVQPYSGDGASEWVEF